jgi:(1->4)-alpha-D-glucan 1-alpha-D-glucosylmutase
LQGFLERLDGAMLKSVREARLRTNWAVPRTDYEQAVSQFVKAALSNPNFLEDFRSFDDKIGPLGAQGGLIETVLKLTVPGVPDIYQGAEFWEQSMVDPDNRREVDFGRRAEALAGTGWDADTTDWWKGGHIKQRLIADILAFRKRDPALFAFGTYEPIELADELPVMAFARRQEGRGLLVAAKLTPSPSLGWSGGVIDFACGSLRSIVKGGAANLDLTSLFPHLPVAVMEFKE